jgi:type VII secretion protein EccB
VSADGGATAYLLYDGRRALVDLADTAVVRALRLEGVVAQRVSHTLLNAVPEVPPISAPRISGAGAPGAIAGFPVGSVLRIARADGDEYYVVLERGVQRVGHVTADLLRLTGARGVRTILSVAPDIIRSAPTIDELPVSTFPDQAAAPPDRDNTLCVAWAHPGSGGADVWFSTGDLPIPAGHAAVTLAQSDGDGPALDSVYLPPGRSAYVRATGLSGQHDDAGTSYLVTDTGVRFAIPDDDAAADLGMPPTPIAAPWPVLATLPAGPELSRRNALVARDTP